MTDPKAKTEQAFASEVQESSEMKSVDVKRRNIFNAPTSDRKAASERFC